MDGAPFELTVALGNDGSSSIRYTFDTGDHRQGLASNWYRYLESAEAVTGTPPYRLPELWELFAKHLDGTAPLVRTPVVHGIGYGARELKRGTLYFHTYWLSHSSLLGRFPDYTDTSRHFDGYPSIQLQAISYDFVEGEKHRTKFYQILDYDGQTEQSRPLAHGQNIEAVRRLVQSLELENTGESSIGRRFVFHSLSLDRKAQLSSAFQFPCPNWGWNSPKGFLELISRLTSTFSLNLWQLYVVLNVFSKYGIQLRPSFIKVGGANHRPDLSFYFSPILEHATRGNSNEARPTSPKSNSTLVRDETKKLLEDINQMVSQAIHYIMIKREKDGSWNDFALPEGKSDEWTTAYIIATLCRIPHISKELTPSVDWLRKRYRPGYGWGYNMSSMTDAESTALAILALKRMNEPLPEDAATTLLKYRLPGGGYSAFKDWDLDRENGLGAVEITSAALLAQIETESIEIDQICESVVNLRSQQRVDGGWNSFWWKDDMLATYRTVLALNAISQFVSAKGDRQLPTDIIKLAVKCVTSTRPSISAQAIPNEPFLLGLWLGSWVGVNGSVFYPSIHRIINSLRSQQQQDGCWLSVPIRRVAMTKLLRPWARSDSGRLYMDQECLITTTTTINGLNALRDYIKQRHDS
jgi:hypothetical protein